MIINKIDLKLYKKYVKKYDYYFVNRDGNQKLGSKATRKYKKNKGVKKEAVKND